MIGHPTHWRSTYRCRLKNLCAEAQVGYMGIQAELRSSNVKSPGNPGTRESFQDVKPLATSGHAEPRYRPHYKPSTTNEPPCWWGFVADETAGRIICQLASAESLWCEHLELSISGSPPGFVKGGKSTWVCQRDPSAFGNRRIMHGHTGAVCPSSFDLCFGHASLEQFDMLPFSYAAPKHTICT